MPTPVPAQNVDDSPKFCIEVNSFWAGIIIGLLDRANDPDFWQGDDEEITHAVDQIEVLIGQFENGC